MARLIPVQTPEERKRRKQARNVRWYAALNKEQVKEHRKRSYKWKLENQESCMLTSARVRSNKSNLPFNIDITDIIIPSVCPVLGIPIIREVRGSGHPTANSASLDKFVPSLGYVKGNVAVISHLANTIKSYATPEQIMAVAIWAKERASK